MTLVTLVGTDAIPKQFLFCEMDAVLVNRNRATVSFFLRPCEQLFLVSTKWISCGNNTCWALKFSIIFRRFNETFEIGKKEKEKGFLLQNGVFQMFELIYYYYPSNTQQMGLFVDMKSHASFLPILCLHTTERANIQKVLELF